MKKRMFGRVAALIAGMLLLQTSAATAQRFHVVLDYHYNLGFSERYDGEKLSRGDGYKMHGNSLHLTALYDITQRISAGAGIGADRYEEPGYNTFPLFGTFRYRPIRTFLDTYVYTNLGYGVFTREDSIYPGWMWDAGVGYTKMFRKHFGLNFQVGYNLKEFHGQNFYEIDPDSGADYVRKFNSVRHSLSLGVGLVF